MPDRPAAPRARSGPIAALSKLPGAGLASKATDAVAGFGALLRAGALQPVGPVAAVETPGAAHPGGREVPPHLRPARQANAHRARAHPRGSHPDVGRAVRTHPAAVELVPVERHRAGRRGGHPAAQRARVRGGPGGGAAGRGDRGVHERSGPRSAGPNAAAADGRAPADHAPPGGRDSRTSRVAGRGRLRAGAGCLVAVRGGRGAGVGRQGGHLHLRDDRHAQGRHPGHGTFVVALDVRRAASNDPAPPRRPASGGGAAVPRGGVGVRHHLAGPGQRAGAGRTLHARVVLPGRAGVAGRLDGRGAVDAVRAVQLAGRAQVRPVLTGGRGVHRFAAPARDPNESPAAPRRRRVRPVRRDRGRMGLGGGPRGPARRQGHRRASGPGRRGPHPGPEGPSGGPGRDRRGLGDERPPDGGLPQGRQADRQAPPGWVRQSRRRRLPRRGRLPLPPRPGRRHDRDGRGERLSRGGRTRRRCPSRRGAELISWAKKLSFAAVPKEVRFGDELSRNHTGKVDKHALAEGWTAAARPTPHARPRAKGRKTA